MFFSYKSFFDATYQTFKNEGLIGFYRGLGPTLAKVVPAVSISYVVYDHVSDGNLSRWAELTHPLQSKKALGVA